MCVCVCVFHAHLEVCLPTITKRRTCFINIDYLMNRKLKL